MTYRLVDSTSSVQIYPAGLTSDTVLCIFESFPSGSYLIKTVPKVDFRQPSGAALLQSLSDATESILQEGIAVGAAGVQLTDANRFLEDAVRFTVRYVPPVSVPGAIEADVDIPAITLTADTSILGGAAGFTSAPEIILDTYNQLKTLSGF